MKVSLIISALAAALAAAPLASAAAAPGVRLVSPPHVFQPWHGGERGAVWRNREGERDAWRRDRGDFVGAVGGEDEFGPEEAPSPLFLSAPIFVDVTLAPGAELAPAESAPGPKLIEIGRGAPRHGHLPLVIYGD
jgi:hypothetical protein